MRGEELLSAVEGDKLERLKWIVLRRLGVSPVSWQARLLSGRRAVICACQLLLDLRSSSSAPGAGNSGFDMEKFKEMRRNAWAAERKK